MTGTPDLDRLARSMPFARMIGVDLVAASADEVVATLPWSPERCTAGGALHGGAIMTLADAAGALAAFLNLPPGAATTTVSSATQFTRGVTAGTATATARPLHVGRSTVVVATDVLDDDGRLVARVTQTQAVLDTP